MKPHPLGGVLVAASVVTLSTACGGAKPADARNAPAPATASAPAAQDGRSAAPGPTQVSISDEIRTRCGIPDEDAYFAFDSSRLRAQDRTPLDLVARCFTNGPLAGRSVKLVGRADPRGMSEYNLTLGQSRADSVGSYLSAHGMDKGKTRTTSRGAMDATGTDETSWQQDRRVDVLLAN
jgi:peptidoglycan-associated lipoprotein